MKVHLVINGWQFISSWLLGGKILAHHDDDDGWSSHDESASGTCLLGSNYPDSDSDNCHPLMSFQVDNFHLVDENLGSDLRAQSALWGVDCPLGHHHPLDVMDANVIICTSSCPLIVICVHSQARRPTSPNYNYNKWQSLLTSHLIVDSLMLIAYLFLSTTDY